MNAKKKFKIAFLSDHFPPKKDGVSTRLAHMVPILQRRSHQVQCFFPASSSELTQIANINAYGIRSLSVGNWRQTPIAFFSAKLLRALHDFQPDIVHAIFNYSFFPIAANWYKKRTHVPLIYGYHTDFSAYAKARIGRWFPSFLVNQIAVKFLNQGDVCLFPSTTIQNHLALHKHIVTGILPAGVDLELFHPNQFSLDFRKRYESEKGKIIIHVGRLAKEKNIDALRPLLNLPDITLLLIGTGVEEMRLRRLFAKTRTHFLGNLEKKELAQAYASSDLLVVPSKTETLGIVMLEAMACGCPIVGANAGAIPDVLSNLSQGARVCNPNNTTEFIQTVQNMLNKVDDATYNYLRQYSQNYTWDNAVDCLLGFYERAYNAHRQ
jgi:glycosyltransferase involved in cell wall biosynthesis